MEGGAKHFSEPEHGQSGMAGRGRQQPPTPPRPPARSPLSPDAGFSALGCSQRCGHPKDGAGGFSPGSSRGVWVLEGVWGGLGRWVCTPGLGSPSSSPASTVGPEGSGAPHVPTESLVFITESHRNPKLT